MSEPIRRVLIAGGTGLVGRALAKALIQDGKEVIILTRNPDQGFGSSEVRPIHWDGKSTQGWSGIIHDVDAIVQLAGANLGSSPWTNERRKLILDSRVLSGQAIAAAVKSSASRPRVLIQASAVGYYGPAPDAVFRESDPPGAGWLSKVCVAWEDSTCEVEDLGVRRAVIRTGLVLDRRSGILPIMALPVSLWAGGKVGTGRQWVSWIHIEDEITAIQSLLRDEGASGAFNLTAPAPVRNAEFERLLAGALHRPFWFPTPAFLIRMLIGKMSELVLEGQNVVPERLSQIGFEFRYRDLGAALKAIYSG